MGRSIWSRKESPPDLQAILPALIPQLGALVIMESKQGPPLGDLPDAPLSFQC
jgi:hypothetical protein